MKSSKQKRPLLFATVDDGELRNARVGDEEVEAFAARCDANQRWLAGRGTFRGA